METAVRINDAANGFVWGTVGLVLLIGTGLICTVITGFFPITHLRHWWKNTFGAINKRARIINDAGALSSSVLFVPRCAQSSEPVTLPVFRLLFA